MLEDFWRTHRFTPMPAGAYFRLSAFMVAGTISMIFLGSLVGSLIPLGLWFAGISEYQRRRDTAWFGDSTYSRADHPLLFVCALGIGYVIGFAIIAFGLYRLGVRTGAV